MQATSVSRRGDRAPKVRKAIDSCRSEVAQACRSKSGPKWIASCPAVPSPFLPSDLATDGEGKMWLGTPCAWPHSWTQRWPQVWAQGTNSLLEWLIYSGFLGGHIRVPVQVPQPTSHLRHLHLGQQLSSPRPGFLGRSGISSRSREKKSGGGRAGLFYRTDTGLPASADAWTANWATACDVLHRPCFRDARPSVQDRQSRRMATIRT